MQENEFLVKDADGRTWRAEVLGPGQRIKVSDIMSPTGYHEWVLPEAVGVRFVRANGQSTKEK